ncbi:hypothetical protein DMC30DRAFT_417972 [Rhodotorula diobovata]|uniref:Uncharacterized protein n=1 Tax=Rhodotorula diobovata TaxID=5288 RepID=A0A5C5FSQ8_9BASI|nr:hypothetical protein DMC30DRAFT_417972 [Rhodotorula diobovata]
MSLGLLDKASDFIQGEQGQNLINKLSGSGNDNNNTSSNQQSSTGRRDESAIQRDDQQSYGGPTSGFDSTSERYTSGQGAPSSESKSATDDAEWEDEDSNRRRRTSTSGRRGDANAYSSSRGDFSPTGAAYGETATPSYGAREAGADGAFLGERDDDAEPQREAQRNNPYSAAAAVGGEDDDGDEQQRQGYERGSEERFDSSYGGGDRGVDFVASGGGSAYGDGLNEYGGAGRNNDGYGRSSYEPDQPVEQRDGRPGGERDNYP